MDFNDFIKKTLGKTIDVDSRYGAQCVDLFNYFNKLYNNCYINCAPSGYAKSLYENRFNNNILNYYKETTVNNMVLGTLVVYGVCKFAPSSHVCFFIKDNGDGTFQALNQNHQGKKYVSIDNMSYNGIIGCLIPKVLEKQKPKEVKENKEYLNLHHEADTWRIYKLNVAPVKGNECGFLKPSKFGGLTYTIIRYITDEVVVIITRDYGEVQIYINTPLASITKNPTYNLVK